MPVKVIDASALASILFNEPDSERVITRIASDALVAPQLISFEVASVCLKKIRAHRRQGEMFLAAFRLIHRLDIDMTSVDLEDVIALAEDTGLTVYDACYLWLARLLKCELVTLDKRLAFASKR
jgi:predicted nucleic acid-binding protein